MSTELQQRADGRVRSTELLGIHELDKLIHDIEWRGLDPSLCSREDIHRLLSCARELKCWREDGLTEEILRRHAGYIKAGRGCVIALASEMPNIAVGRKTSA